MTHCGGLNRDAPIPDTTAGSAQKRPKFDHTAAGRGNRGAEYQPRLLPPPEARKTGLDKAQSDMGCEAMKTYEYNLNKQPASYDFLVWLDKCYSIEKRPYHVVINGDFKLRQLEVYGENTQIMFDNVVIPSLELFPVTYELFTGRSGYQVSHMVRGERLGNLTVPAHILEETKHAQGHVIMVMRETPWHPQRNSNREAWLEAAEIIKEPVIFLEDGLKQQIPLAIRAGLYQNASCVLGVNGGAMAPAWHNKSVRYVTFKPISDAPCCTMQDYLDKGFTYGGSWPWATKDQLYCWAEDSVENILEGYQRLCH